MRKRTFYFMLLISAAVITSGTVWTQAGDGDSFGRGLGFGQRIAGTYRGELTVDFGGGPILVGTGALSLHADGTLTASSSACCGSGADHNVQSEGIGNWTRTDDRQIELSAMIVGVEYDDHCTLDGEYAGQAPCDEGETLVECPSAACNFECTASQQLDFASDFQSADGLLVTYCTYSSGKPDLCTADVVPVPILVHEERMPVQFPACE